jgi:2-methylcitrate dehydratase PrpD
VVLDIEAPLSEFVSTLDLSDVSPSAVIHAKTLIVDAVGCALAGDLSEETPIVRRTATQSFGSGSSTVVGSRERLSPAGATLVNAYLITAMTVCDVYRPAHCHMTPLVVPPALTAAEETGATGQELLVAAIAGMELMARIALGLDYPAFRARGWHSPGVIGPFGAAAAFGRVKGFDAETMLRALGLAATQSAGSYLSWGTPAVKFHQARGAVSGLLAAQMAEQGFIGGIRPLTADDGGIYNTHSNGGKPELAIEGLGTQWEMEQIAVRLWPGASPVQTMLTALFDLIDSEGVAAGQISSVEIGISSEDYKTHGGFSRPAGTFEALLSYAYLASLALHDQRVWFDGVRPPRIHDDQLLDFGEHRVRLVEVSDLPVNGCELTLRLGDGRELHRRVEQAKGTAENPATRADVDKKFLLAAEPRLGEDAAGELLAILWDLERQDHLGILWSLLSTT